MKKLYNILNEGILDVDDVITQLEDAAELGCLEKIFKLVGEFVDEQRQKDNRWRSVLPTGGGKRIEYDPPKGGVRSKKYLDLIQQFESMANYLQITGEQAKVIAENPNDFVAGRIYRYGDILDFEILVPHGSKFMLYTIRTHSYSSSPWFEISISPIKPTKNDRWIDMYYNDIIQSVSNTNEGNFAIPYDKATRRRIKGFLYNFDGFVRMK